MPIFQCYVLPFPTVGQPEIFLKNPLFFKTSSAVDRSIRLLTRSSLDKYLASKLIFSPLEISTQPQVGQKTQAGRVFSQIVWCLGRCVYCKIANSSSNQSRLYNDICVFAYADPDSYTRTKLYLSYLQQEAPQTHHPIFQDVMLVNIFTFFLFVKMIFDIHIQTSNPREPPKLSSLLLAPTFFFV